jgi:hypothetical protein
MFQKPISNIKARKVHSVQDRPKEEWDSWIPDTWMMMFAVIFILYPFRAFSWVMDRVHPAKKDWWKHPICWWRKDNGN